MISALSLASLLGVILWLQVRQRVRPEASPLVGCVLVLLVEYGAALFGELAAERWAAYAVGLVLGAASIPRFKTLPSALR